jgi:peptidoglycan/LPS O-acetylase OafA/YrhL
VSILVVILFHAGLGFKGGYIGVDVFFVISGYLITAMLLRQMQRGQICLVDFWERRIRRIFPALCVMVLATMTAGLFLMLPDALVELAESSVAQSLMGANIHFWFVSDYFSTSAEERPLLHTWSLAVEEQFYLLLPLVLIIILKTSTPIEGQRHRTGLWLLVLFVISFVAGLACTYTSPDFAFYWLPTRAWELLVGSLLAARPQHWTLIPAKWKEAAGWGGLVAILVAALAFENDTPFPGIAALLPCLGAAALLVSNETALNGPGRLLSTRPAVFIGRISYSLYLWHWPLLAFGAYLTATSRHPAAGVRIALLLAGFLLAWLSWRWVETPVRERRILGSRRSLFSMAALMTAIMITFSWLLIRHEGWPARVNPQALSYLTGVNNLPAYADYPFEKFRDTAGPDFPRIGKVDEEKTHLMVWGDSHAGRVLPAVQELSLQQGHAAQFAFYSSTSPVLGFYRPSRHSLNERTQAWAEQVVATVREKRIPHTLLVGYWQKAPDKQTQRFSEALLHTVSELRKTGTQVWILLDVPSHTFDVDKALSLHALRPEFITDPAKLATTRQQHEAANQLMYDLVPALEKAGARVLDPLPYFLSTDGQRTLLEEGGRALYTDPHHLSAAGSQRLVPLLEPLFK